MSGIPPSLAIALQKLQNRKRRSQFDAASVLTPAQLTVRRSKHKRRAMHCGRRWGKSTEIAVEFLEESIAPPVDTAAALGYCTLTRVNAKTILWPELLRLDQEFNLGCKINGTELTVTRPGGSPIVLLGANNDREVKKIRGHKYKRFAIDELQSFPESVANHLMTEVLPPTLADYDAPLIAAFTPPPTKFGYAYEIAAGKLRDKWEVFTGTLEDNTELPVRKLYGKTPAQIFQEVLDEFGWTWDHPTFQREWLGKLVEDLEALLYAFTHGMNDCLELPKPSECTNVLAIDLGGPEGGDDTDAIWGWGWKRHERTLYQTWEDEGNGDIDALVERIRPAMEALKPIAVVMDTGGLGKKIAAQINNRYNLPEGIIPAEKVRKPEFTKLMNTDWRRGRLKIHPNSKLADELKRVERDPEAWKVAKLTEKKGGFHGNLTDAALYGWRWADHYMEEPKPPPRTTQQAIDAEHLPLDDPDDDDLDDDIRGAFDDDRRLLGV